MRRFELRTESFWTIAVNGEGYPHLANGRPAVTTTAGRVGTPGQSKTVPYATYPAAVAAADKLIAERLAEGYVEVGADDADLDRD